MSRYLPHAFLAVVTVILVGCFIYDHTQHQVRPDPHGMRAGCDGRYMTRLPDGGCLYADGYARCEYRPGVPLVCYVGSP